MLMSLAGSEGIKSRSARDGGGGGRRGWKDDGSRRVAESCVCGCDSLSVVLIIIM